MATAVPLGLAAAARTWERRGGWHLGDVERPPALDADRMAESLLVDRPRRQHSRAVDPQRRAVLAQANYALGGVEEGRRGGGIGGGVGGRLRVWVLVVWLGGVMVVRQGVGGGGIVGGRMVVETEEASVTMRGARVEQLCHRVVVRVGHVQAYAAA
eukprot:scaffold21957_cov56-Phaeocystis_antarctica.AAC.1